MLNQKMRQKKSRASSCAPKDILWKTIRIGFLTSIILLSCATSPGAFREIDHAVLRSDYSQAINAIVRSQSESITLYDERNAISLFLDKGLLEYYAGNHAASSADLENAERLIGEAYTKSVTQGFLSYIINDNLRDYPGEDFEDIYLNIFNALNYYNRGSVEGALVEIRKLSGSSGKLSMLQRKYDYEDPATGAGLQDLTYRETGVSDMPRALPVNFSNSALARFLGALFFQTDGNYDATRIERGQLEQAFAENRSLYYNPIPKAAQDAFNVPPESARLNIICFTGLSPVKEEKRVTHYLPFQHPILQVAYFKLPGLKKRASLISRIEVIVEGAAGIAGGFNMELLEDMGAVIEETFKARYSNILIKTYIRTILKYAVADIAAMETIKKSGEFAGLSVATAARIGADATESADIRMSRFLPDKAYIGGINLDPGVYSVIINYYQGNDLIYSDAREDVKVSDDELNLLQSINLR